jgi:hypothetical protein
MLQPQCRKVSSQRSATENGLNGVNDTIDIIPFPSSPSITRRSERCIFIEALGRLARDLRRRCGEGERRSGPPGFHPPLEGEKVKEELSPYAMHSFLQPN